MTWSWVRFHPGVTQPDCFLTVIPYIAVIANDYILYSRTVYLCTVQCRETSIPIYSYVFIINNSVPSSLHISNTFLYNISSEAISHPLPTHTLIIFFKVLNQKLSILITLYYEAVFGLIFQDTSFFFKRNLVQCTHGMCVSGRRYP